MEAYYDPSDLPRFAEIGEDNPGLWEKFSGWYGAVFEEGTLSRRE